MFSIIHFFHSTNALFWRSLSFSLSEDLHQVPSRHCESNPFEKAVGSPKDPTTKQCAQWHVDVTNDLSSASPVRFKMFQAQLLPSCGVLHTTYLSSTNLFHVFHAMQCDDHKGTHWVVVGSNFASLLQSCRPWWWMSGSKRNTLPRESIVESPVRWK